MSERSETNGTLSVRSFCVQLEAVKLELETELGNTMAEQKLVKKELEEKQKQEATLSECAPTVFFLSLFSIRYLYGFINGNR